MDAAALLDEVERSRTLPPRVMRGTRREPTHVRFGGRVHYGSGRKAHIGVKSDKGPAHFYRNRMYIGTAKQGRGRRLTQAERVRVGALFDELEQINAVRSARHSGVRKGRRMVTHAR